MKSERIRVSSDFANKLRNEKNRLDMALKEAGKKKELSFVGFTKLCRVSAPSIVVPDLKTKGKKKLEIQEKYNITKLI